MRMKSSLPSILVTSTAIDVATDLGDHETRGRAGLVLGLQLAVLEARRAQVLGQLLVVDDGLALAALGHLAGDLAHDVGDLALQVAHAGLVGVGLDQRHHRLVGDLDVLGLEAVVLHLLGHQEALRRSRSSPAGCSPAAG